MHRNSYREWQRSCIVALVAAWLADQYYEGDRWLSVIRTVTFDCYGTLIDRKMSPAHFFIASRSHQRPEPPSARLLQQESGGDGGGNHASRLSILIALSSPRACAAGKNRGIPGIRPTAGVRGRDAELATIPRHRPRAPAGIRGGIAARDYFEHRPRHHRTLAPPPRCTIRRGHHERGMPRV